MKIRESSIEEFAAVSQLWRRSGIEIRPGDNREDLRRKLERDSDLFLVAEEGSKIVGSVMGAWDGRRGWIYHLAVDPRFRRKHIARKMILEVERRMKDKGVPRVNAMVYLWNGPSLNLFENLGYKKQVDLAVMGKTLGGSKHGVKTDNSGRRQRRSRSLEVSRSRAHGS
jgi:ribosomal protein S18 acetylase RimI-like enzyme